MIKHSSANLNQLSPRVTVGKRNIQASGRRSSAYSTEQVVLYKVHLSSEMRVRDKGVDFSTPKLHPTLPCAQRYAVVHTINTRIVLLPRICAHIDLIVGFTEEAHRGGDSTKAASFEGARKAAGENDFRLELGRQRAGVS